MMTQYGEKNRIENRRRFYKHNYVAFKEELSPVNRILAALGYKLLAERSEPHVWFKLVRLNNMETMYTNMAMFPSKKVLESAIDFLSNNSFWERPPSEQSSLYITFPSFSSLLELEMKLKIAGKIT